MLAVPVTGYPQLYSLTFNVAWFASLDVCMRGKKEKKGIRHFLYKSNAIQHLLHKYTYIIFSNRSKLASTDCETTPTL